MHILIDWAGGEVDSEVISLFNEFCEATQIETKGIQKEKIPCSSTEDQKNR